jgi:hypothetical protein
VATKTTASARAASKAPGFASTPSRRIATCTRHVQRVASATAGFAWPRRIAAAVETSACPRRRPVHHECAAEKLMGSISPDRTLILQRGR